MDRKRRYIGLTLLIALCSIVSGWAQEFQLTLECPETVGMDQKITVSYMIKAPVRDFTAEIKTEFSAQGADVQSGPHTSTSTSASFVNGKRSCSKSICYSYVVRSNNSQRVIRIEPMTFEVQMEDKVVAQLSTPEKVIHVVGNMAAQDVNKPSKTTVTQSAQNEAEAEDILICWTTDREVAHLGDTLVCMCDLYTQVAPTQLTPLGRCEINDCVVLDDTMTSISLDKVEYRGRQYQHARLQTIKIVPLRTGAFKIGGNEYELLIKEHSIFDDFFSSPSSSRYRYKVKSEIVSFRVEGFPDMQKADTETGDECFLICDVSGSMDIQDMEPTRKGCVEDFANTWLAEVPESGIVTFAGGVEQYYPAKTGLRSVRLMDEPKKDGTAIGDAMVTPIARGAKVKDLIVVTDGANNMGYLSLRTAFRIMNRYNVRVSYVYLNSGNDSVQCVLKGQKNKVTIENMRVPETELQQIKRMVEHTGGLFGIASDKGELMGYLMQLESLVESPKEPNKSFSVIDEKMLQKVLQEWKYKEEIE